MGSIDDQRTISLDEVFELLSSRRRRYALYELREESHVKLSELAERVAAREHDASDAVPETDRQRVEIALHHIELPRLHEAKLLEYDARHGDVSAATYFGLIEKYLELAEEDETG